MKLNKLPLNVIGLNRVGLNQIGSPSRRANTSDRPYIDPEVLASLVAVCICDGKSNDDPDRAVIKNLVDPDNPFVISNAAYEGMSGHNGYPVVFGANKTWEQMPTGTFTWNIDDNKLHITKALIAGNGLLFSYVKLNGSLLNVKEIPSFKIKVSGLEGKSKLWYRYLKTEDAISETIAVLENGTHELPKSYTPSDSLHDGVWVGFTVSPISEGVKEFDCDITIEVLPEYEGAFVTDGKDDLITSTKTVKEMLGGSNEVTVVSMMLNLENEKITYTNQIRPFQNGYIRNDVISNTGGKYGIYGYKITDISDIFKNRISINDILGDRKDYGMDAGGTARIDGKFSVEGYCFNDGTIGEMSQVAWYWTIIAKIALTTDQINQVISYFNLDKHVKPDIIYDTIRQGITNENHASFNDELTDFSGNGHNMKIYNSAWNKESGINDEGAWQADGVTDYGQYIGDLGLQDYTIAVDRAYVEAKPSQVSIMSNVVDGSTNTPFLMEHMGINKILAPHSFGKYTALSELNINRFISYQSTYKYNRNNLDRGTSTNTGSGLTIGRIGGVASQYANIALWSLLLFPYTLSEFLLERQLKRYKLGTLYPDMVEFRPVISGNIPYNAIEISQGSTTLYNKSINKTGIYLQEGSAVRVYIQPSGIDEVSKITINGVEYTDLPINPNGFYYADFPIAKSPQKISYAIDEYIRYEDIVQPYPAIINLKQDGKTITWGDKLKVGSDIVFVESANLLPELYTVSETRYNGVTLYPNTIIKVEKSMVFDNARTYLKANEPSCILSPNRLRIPNSSYKILGYIPDLTGKGNHGRLKNFAYTEESGANEDGSIRFDGTDDHITIPNVIGGKCIMAKVTINRNSGIIYDQRRANVPNKSWMQLNPSSVIFEQNAVSTYIDGILNHNVTGSDLVSKTVNLTCELEIGDTSGTYQPTIGSSYAVGYTTNINLYEFMLFPDVPDEEEIQELNDIVGIENNIEVS